MAGSMAELPPSRIADVFCEQVRAAVARSTSRGKVAVVIADNRKRAHCRRFAAGAQYTRRVEGAPLSRLYACL